MRSHPARHAVARAATPTTDVANRGSAEPGRRGRRTNRRRNTTIFGAAVTAAALSGRIATDRNGRAFLGGDLARRRRRRGADVVLRLGHRPDRHRLVDSAVALSTTETYQQTTGSTQHSYAISGAFDKHKPVNDGLDSSGKNNGVSFKGIFVRGPRQLATAAKTTDHDAWLNARASSIEAHDTTSTGFGVSWAGPIRELSSGSTASAGARSSRPCQEPAPRPNRPDR